MPAQAGIQKRLIWFAPYKQTSLYSLYQVTPIHYKNTFWMPACANMTVLLQIQITKALFYNIQKTT